MSKLLGMVFAVCGTTLVVGCDRADLTGADGAPQDALSLNATGVTASATGGGWLEKEVLPIQYSFSAIQKSPDGTATGQFHYSVIFGGELIEFYGLVTCLTVDPVNHRAWVGGVITQNNSTHPFWLQEINEVGRDIWFRVEDNGEGGNAVEPDLSTFVGFEGSRGIITSEEYCDSALWPEGDEGTNQVTQGNISVRG